MDQQNFWKKHVKVTYRFIVFFVLLVFVLSGFSTGVFLNFVYPYLSEVPFLNLINPRLPVIVNKTEQIVVNDGVDTRQLYDRLKNVTVTVVSYPFTLDPQDRKFAPPRIGSGLVVTSDGLVFTTRSIIGSGQIFLKVITSAGQTYDGKVLATDPKSSLVILKIQAENLPVLPFEQAARLMVGDKLVSIRGAFSNYDLPGSIVWVSALPAVILDYSKILNSDSVSESLTTSPVLPDSYEGGALVNRSGAVAGLKSGDMILTGEYLQASLNTFLSRHALSRAGLGIQYVKITPAISQILNLPKTSGILISASGGKPGVAAGSAAAAAGLKDGDFVYKVGEELVDDKNSFEKILNGHQPDDTVSMTFYRDGRDLSVQVIFKAIK